MKNYLKFPLPTTSTWFRLPERVKALEETGVGSQDLQSVTTQGNTTTNDIEFIDGAKILFENGSRLQKGTTNSYTGGNGGISQVCSIDYELKWEAGSQYVMGSNGFTIREVNHTFIATPGVNDDSTRGFVPDSRWILDNGDIYLCTDNTEGAAVWELQGPKYKVYSALLTQSGTSNPVPTVLDNPDGLVINFSRTTTGLYTISSTSFIRGKVIVNNVNPYIESSWELSDTGLSFPKILTGGGPPAATREIKIPTAMFTTGTDIKFSTLENGAYADDVLSKYNAFVEIRVYN